MIFERELEKQIADLKGKISILLSCKNCPENKGGLICVKEYENKCLTQKIQYIKELQEENAELKENLATEKRLTTMQDETVVSMTNKLTTAKKIISEYISILKGDTKNWKKTQEKAEQFLSEVEK